MVITWYWLNFAERLKEPQKHQFCFPKHTAKLECKCRHTHTYRFTHTNSCSQMWHTQEKKSVPYKNIKWDKCNSRLRADYVFKSWCCFCQPEISTSQMSYISLGKYQVMFIKLFVNVYVSSQLNRLLIRLFCSDPDWKVPPFKKDRFHMLWNAVQMLINSIRKAVKEWTATNQCVCICVCAYTAGRSWSNIKASNTL